MDSEGSLFIVTCILWDSCFLVWQTSVICHKISEKNFADFAHKCWSVKFYTRPKSSEALKFLENLAAELDDWCHIISYCWLTASGTISLYNNIIMDCCFMIVQCWNQRKDMLVKLSCPPHGSLKFIDKWNCPWCIYMYVRCVNVHVRTSSNNMWHSLRARFFSHIKESHGFIARLQANVSDTLGEENLDRSESEEQGSDHSDAAGKSDLSDIDLFIRHHWANRRDSYDCSLSHKGWLQKI